ncbi:amidase signature enzyme [Violaceomyces palustris]|uniref:Amidase signature enzyme n=1 Tax=Violaceomyces palustris TaxID=1673888 RepID=A0ACD0P453_9BASI|nr:amidase signature enzyme [Violaceomyces palustris]
MTNRSAPADPSADRDWKAIAEQHRASIAIPNSLVSSDTALSQWLHLSNASYDPPSDDLPGPSFDSLLASPQTSKILTPEFKSLTDPTKYDATDLVLMAKQGKVSVVTLTEAFLTRAAIAQQATGCLSDFFGDEARERAKSLDEKRKRLEQEGKLDQLGSLFGLPMSVKGHMSVPGHGNQRGFVFDVLESPGQHPVPKSRLSAETVEMLEKTQGGFMPAPGVTAHLVKILLDADAVIVGKTTMPQGIMHLDTRSNLYGQTLNPHNLALSPGGSSGGESALVAAGGSALGVGTDIGGSIRQPCGVTGLYGLRPTCGRMPYAGFRSTMLGNEGVGSACGPMARSLRDVELFMKVMLQEHTPWEDEHMCVRMPWKDSPSFLNEPGKKPVRIAVMMCDNGVMPATPVRRALQTYVDKLQKWGQSEEGKGRIELVAWDPRDLHIRAWDLIRELYFFDGGKRFRDLAAATGEPLLPLTEFILSGPFVRDHELTASETWELNLKREKFRAEFLLAWNQVGADVLLCPVMAGPPPRPGKIKYWGYTSVFNLVDYPGVVFPTGLVADSDIDKKFEEQLASAGKMEDYSKSLRYGAESNTADLGDFDRENRKEYEDHRKVFDGAPLGLQLIAKKYKDEELIKYLELIQHAVKSA